MRRAAAPSCAPATETAQDRSTATFQGRPSWMIPGWRPSPVPGSPEVSIHPANIPAIREPIHEPRRHPGVPAGVLAHPLRRDPATSFAAKGDGPPVQQARQTGCQHHGNPEDPVGGMSAYSCSPVQGRRSGRRSSSRSNRCHTYAEVPRSLCGCRSASAGS